MLAIGTIKGKHHINQNWFNVELISEEGEVLGTWVSDKHAPSPSIYEVDLQDQFCYPVPLKKLNALWVNSGWKSKLGD